MDQVNTSERRVLVLQGGGALGAYQAGAYAALAAADYQPDWIAGISIGAINAAIIAGNPVAERVPRLRAFWQRVTAHYPAMPWLPGPVARQLFLQTGAAATLTAGVPGFFAPRFPPAGLRADGSPAATSYYDTSPLVQTLRELVDFDYLNDHGPRLSVGAVDIALGNFDYFDSSATRIGPEHILASGALPPGFPGVAIGERHYWDGGLVSNTPLQVVLEEGGDDPLCIFQVDLFSARGALPATLDDVGQRDKDIRYSSRTRLTTDRFRALYDIAAAARRLSEKLPPELRDDPDAARLRAVAPERPVTLVHLIHRKQDFETQTKDYEFSRLSMLAHWAAGEADVAHTLGHVNWRERTLPEGGIRVFDLGRGDA